MAMKMADSGKVESCLLLANACPTSDDEITIIDMAVIINAWLPANSGTLRLKEFKMEYSLDT